MANRQLGNNALDEILRLSHYFILGSDLLLYRAHPLTEGMCFKDSATKYKIKAAIQGIETARKNLDTFDEVFVKAADGSAMEYDKFMAIAYDLIAFCIAYLHYAFEDMEKSTKVFEFIRQQAKELDPDVDNIIDYFLEREAKIYEAYKK